MNLLMDFRQWAERTLRTAEGGESLVRQVQLTTEGQTWQTWDAPFIVDSLTDEAATMLAQLAEESPVRRCTATFIASGADGSVRGSLPVSYMGKNKQAGELSMGATANPTLSHPFEASSATFQPLIERLLELMGESARRRGAASELSTERGDGFVSLPSEAELQRVRADSALVRTAEALIALVRAADAQ